ncbi:MAG: hypothetical protein Q7J34_11020 [Bacteroidales bacterium]|nr:hypothetical protein [Bacteroidales bacterium]
MDRFIANRISQGNTVFPDKIIIEPDYFELYKATLVGYKKTRLKTSDIASIHIHQHLLFADIIIETKGGRLLEANGFVRSQAQKIKALLCP